MEEIKIDYTQLIKDILNILDLTIYFLKYYLTKEKLREKIFLFYKKMYNQS